MLSTAKSSTKLEATAYTSLPKPQIQTRDPKRMPSAIIK